MMILSSYWILVGLIVLMLAVLFVREVYQLSRLPLLHKERMLLGFNAGFLLCLVCVSVVLAGMVDARRVALESELPPYPYARYAHERSGLSDTSTQVYVTSHDSALVRSHIRNVAHDAHLPFIEDTASNVMQVTLPSGVVYVTLNSEGEHQLILISRVGVMATTTAPVPSPS
jgi:hypothetical protein